MTEKKARTLVTRHRMALLGLFAVSAIIVLGFYNSMQGHNMGDAAFTLLVNLLLVLQFLVALPGWFARLGSKVGTLVLVVSGCITGLLLLLPLL